MKDNIIRDKTFNFAIRIVNLYKYLAYDKKEYILSKQILRSGTSIGANVEEAIGGFSEKDFVSKLSISYKEARETLYWIKLLLAGKFINYSQAESLIIDCDEICKIIAKIRITMNNKNNS
jgi:four helix bundle protein